MGGCLSLSLFLSVSSVEETRFLVLQSFLQSELCYSYPHVVI